jgi:deoxycytidine triphosphate deaminase
MIIPLSQWESSGIAVRGGSPLQRIDPVSASDPDEQIVLDLHVGAVRYAPGPDAGRTLKDHRPIAIDPGEAFRFETIENFTIGPMVFGQVCSRASLTSRGLVVANIKVDPKFQGCLAVTVYNIGRERVTIQRDEPFCSVFFQQLTVEVDGPVRTPPGPIPRGSRPFTEALVRNKQIVVTAIVALVVSIAGSLIASTFDSNAPSSNSPATHSTVTSVP